MKREDDTFCFLLRIIALLKVAVVNFFGLILPISGGCKNWTAVRKPIEWHHINVEAGGCMQVQTSISKLDELLQNPYDSFESHCNLWQIRYFTAGGFCIGDPIRPESEGPSINVTSKNFKLTVSLASSTLLVNRSIAINSSKSEAFDIPSQFEIESSSDEAIIISTLLVFTEDPYSVNSGEQHSSVKIGVKVITCGNRMSLDRFSHEWKSHNELLYLHSREGRFMCQVCRNQDHWNCVQWHIFPRLHTDIDWSVHHSQLPACQIEIPCPICRYLSNHCGQHRSRHCPECTVTGGTTECIRCIFLCDHTDG